MMLDHYLHMAMKHAEVEQAEDGLFYGEIPQFKGAWGQGKTAEECRESLREIAEEWVLINIYHHTPLPEIDGVSLGFSYAQAGKTSRTHSKTQKAGV